MEAEHSPDRIDRYVDSYAQATITRKIEAIRAKGRALKSTNAPVPAAELRAVRASSTPTPPKFQAPAPSGPASPEAIKAFRDARLSLLARASRSTGDPLRDLATAQLEEARASRATDQSESA